MQWRSGPELPNYLRERNRANPQAPLAVTANDATRFYGMPNPTFGSTLSGFVNGDSAAVILGAPAFSTPATVFSDTDTYPINASVGTLSSSNYAFNFFAGKLHVIPRRSKSLPRR